MDALRGLYAKLRLRINEDKSAVARVWGRQFLGFSVWTAPGKVINRRVAPKALQAMKERVRQLTARNGGRSIGDGVASPRRYLAGWRTYFRLADTPGVFADVDKWLHRRLRALHLKHWKRGTTVYRERRARGVSDPMAGMAARFSRNWWRVAGHRALHVALPTAYFDGLGVPRLAARSPQLAEPPDTDPYVRWCGRGRVGITYSPLSRFQATRPAMARNTQSVYPLWDHGALTPGGCSGQPEEHQHGPVQPEHILVVELTKTRPELCLRYRGGLVRHQAARRPQSIAFVRLHREPEQGSVGRVRRGRADRYGVQRVEPIILHYHNRSGLPRIVLTARRGPDLAASHSEIASTKS